jgi:hypothetical protein
VNIFEEGEKAETRTEDQPFIDYIQVSYQMASSVLNVHCHIQNRQSLESSEPVEASAEHLEKYLQTPRQY